MKLAFETGSDPKFVYPFGHTALHRCGEFGNTECAEMLLLKGADLMAVNQVGDAPLDCANRGGHVQTASIMKHAVRIACFPLLG